MQIREPNSDVEWAAYYDLRYRALRQPLGKPRGTERDVGDTDTGSKHFALFADDDTLCAIARLDAPKPRIAQVRFVAVDATHRRCGYGTHIMRAVEEAARARGDVWMVLHARDYAMDFYISLDYHTIRMSYKLFGVLQHYLLRKQLLPKDVQIRIPATSEEWQSFNHLVQDIQFHPSNADSILHLALFKTTHLIVAAQIQLQNHSTALMRCSSIEDYPNRFQIAAILVRQAEDIVAKRQFINNLLLDIPLSSLQSFLHHLDYHVVHQDSSCVQIAPNPNFFS